MKTLKEYLFESESSVAQFLKANYKGKFKISDKPNKDGKYEVVSKNEYDKHIRNLNKKKIEIKSDENAEIDNSEL